MRITWTCTPIQGLPDGGIDIRLWAKLSPHPKEAVLTLCRAAQALKNDLRSYEGRAYTTGTVVWFAVFATDDPQVQYVLIPHSASA